MRKLKRCWGLWSGRVSQLLKSFTWMTNFEQRAHEWQSGQKVTAAGSCGADHLQPEVLASGHWSQWTHTALLDLKPRWTRTFVLTWPLGKEGARVTLAASLWDLDRTYFYTCCICWLQICPPWLGPPSWTQQLGNITLTLVKNAQMLPFWLGINRNGSLLLVSLAWSKHCPAPLNLCRIADILPSLLEGRLAPPVLANIHGIQQEN